MKKDILIITHFNTFFNEPGNSRFTYLIKMLNCEENNVEVISSSFSHTTKKQRNFNKSNSLDYKLTLIKEPSYKNNVSLLRVYSHIRMGVNLKRYLEVRKVPDIIYCAVPSLEIAKVAASYANKKNIKFIIDIQDLWPEAFEMVFKVPILKNIVFGPMNKKANYIYGMADEIVAVSDTYKKRAMAKNNKFNRAIDVYLGNDLEYFDEITRGYKSKKNKEFFTIVYIGTLGHSYNIKLVIDALANIKKRGISNIKFLVMGDGPLMNKFQRYASKKEVNCEFTGRLDYETMINRLVESDIAVNPIHGKSAATIINKVGDYATAGLPVINTQQCEEYRSLLDKYGAGINCDNGNIEDLEVNIVELYKDSNLRRKYGQGNRKLAEDKFNRSITYKKIIDLIVN